MNNAKQNGEEVPLVMPRLGLDVRWTACQWLARIGATVVEGDRILEVLGGDVTVDLPAPVSGRLTRKLVAAEQPLEAGQTLGFVTLGGGE